MDALTLLHHAVNVGLRVEAIRGNLLVQGPKRLEPVVKLRSSGRVIQDSEQH
jgi:hypothetical protein